MPGPSLLIQPAGYPQNTLASELAHGRRGFVTRFLPLASSRIKRETNNTDLLLHRRPELYSLITRSLDLTGAAVPKAKQSHARQA